MVIAFLGADALGIDLRDEPPVSLRRAAEAAVIICVLAWGLRPLPLRDLAEAAGRPLLAVLVAMLALIAVVQVTVTPQPRYPFSAWDMYATTPDAALYPTLEIISPSGGVERVRLAEVLPVVTPRPFAATLTILARAHEEEFEGIEEVLSDVGRLLAGRAGATDADRFRISVCVVDDPTPAEPSTCRPILEDAVSEQDLR